MSRYADLKQQFAQSLSKTALQAKLEGVSDDESLADLTAGLCALIAISNKDQIANAFTIVMYNIIGFMTHRDRTSELNEHQKMVLTLSSLVLCAIRGMACIENPPDTKAYMNSIVSDIVKLCEDPSFYLKHTQ